MSRVWLCFAVMVQLFAFLISKSEAGFEIGQRIVVSERCTISDFERGNRTVIYEYNPGDFASVESIQGNRIRVRNVTIGACWIDSRSVVSLADAERLFSNWIIRGHNVSRAHFGRGQVRGIAGDFPISIADLSTAIQMEPHNSTFLVGRGKMELRYRQYTLATSDFTEAVRLTKSKSDINSQVNCAEALYHRGMIRFEELQFEEAIADFEQAKLLAPEWELIHNRCGMTRRQLGNLEQAIIDFKRAQELSPSFSAPRNFRAKTLADLGRYQEAITEYEAAVALTQEAVFVVGTISQDLHQRLSKSETSSVEEYWQLQADFSIQNNLARLLLECPVHSLRNTKRARELVDFLRLKDHRRYYEFLKTEAAVLETEGRSIESMETLAKAAEAAPPEQRAVILASMALDTKNRYVSKWAAADASELQITLEIASNQSVPIFQETFEDELVEYFRDFPELQTEAESAGIGAEILKVKLLAMGADDAPALASALYTEQINISFAANQILNQLGGRSLKSLMRSAEDPQSPNRITSYVEVRNRYPLAALDRVAVSTSEVLDLLKCQSTNFRNVYAELATRLPETQSLHAAMYLLVL